MSIFQEAQLRDQEREVALKEAEEESRLQEQVPKSMGIRIEGIRDRMNVGERGLTELFIFARWKKLSAEANRRLGRLKRRKRHDRFVTKDIKTTSKLTRSKGS